MDGKSTYLAHLILDRLGGQAVSTLTNVYVALFDSAGAELSGSGYARKTVAANQTNWPAAASRTIANGVVIDFDPASGTPGTWSDIYRAKLMDASSSGNVLYQGFLGSDRGKAFTAIDAGDVITVPGHALVVNDRAVILAIDDSTLPTGLTDELLVYIKTVSGNDVTVSLTEGGAAIDVTAAGSGLIKKVTPKTGITAPDFVRIGIGELSLKEA